MNVTYILTRDTNCVGTLSDVIDCWYRRPIRCHLRFPNGHVWMPSRDPGKEPSKPGDLGYYGAYSLAEARRLFKTIPDTDLEVVINICPTAPDPK